jgi:hypothetical protein
MFQSYQPAVLAAALIAIIAAAQHLGTLHDQAGKVDQQLTSLGQQGVTLNTTLDRVSRIASSTQLSLNDTGKEIFIQDVYRAYGKARTIYAVIRDHGIEQEWWSHALETADTRQDGLKKVWEWYYGPAEKNSKLDLYRALTGPRRQDDVGEVVGVRAAYFVSYMPMPDFSNQGAATTDWNSDKSGLFKDLLGLAWECLVLDKVRSELKNAELIGEWISRPLCWAHATEKEVLQVVKRVPDTESTVFKTADLGTSELNNLDPGMSKKVIESMQAEIRRYLQRGVPAEEYLCALIGYASAYDAQSVLHENPESHLCDDKIAAYLSRMHMDEWIKDQQQHARDQSRSLAVAIFKEFLHMCWTRSQVGLDKKIAEPTDQTLFLAREVL